MELRLQSNLKIHSLNARPRESSSDLSEATVATCGARISGIQAVAVTGKDHLDRPRTVTICSIQRLWLAQDLIDCSASYMHEMTATLAV